MADEPRKLSDAEIAFIKEQTRLLAADLAFYARGPVKLHLIGGNQFGFTYDAGGEGSIINIHLNPSVLVSIRNQDHAVKVWRGLGFHELAHHLWPAHEQYKKAYEEGFKDLFNLLDDEQNERRGRSKDPSWGACFQSLVAYVIRKNKSSRWNEVTGEGKDDKEKAPPPTGYISRFNEFLYHLRRHLPGAKDPIVIEALALIPPQLKDLSKDELLGLARAVHTVLMRGIELPPAPEAVAQPAEPEPEASPEPEAPEQPEEPGGIPVPLWRRLTGSKWFYVMIAIFSAGWFAVFTHKGLDGWDSAFYVTSAMAVLSIFLVTLIFWLESRRKPGTTPPAPPNPKQVSGWLASVKSGCKNIWDSARRICDQVLDALDRIVTKYTPKSVAAVFEWLSDWVVSPIWQALKWSAQLTWRLVCALWSATCAVWKWTSKVAWQIWHSRIFRAFLLSAPVAALLAMIVAVIVKTNWLALLVLLIIALLLALLAWLFRARIKKFLITAMQPEEPGPDASSASEDMDEDMVEFSVINNIVPVQPDQASLDKLLPDVLPLALQMRRFLEQTGLGTVDHDDQETGYELIDEIEKVALGETGLLVDDKHVAKASVHIEVGIDCSGSMANSNKIEMAKRFGLLIEESVRGVRGITARFWGFTDTVIYDCGVPGQQKISGLRSNGGNNDSAALWHMSRSAAASGRELRILLMVSDGEPSECTWGSLHNLVCRLEMSGFIPVQIAVDKIKKPAFEKYYVDLVGQPMASAIIDFGRILMSLVEGHK